MSETIELGSLPKDTFSFSQFSMWSRCPQQYAYRYLEGLKDPPGSNMILGRATHKGLELGYKDHLEKGAPPKLKFVQEAASSALDDELKIVPVSEVNWGKKGDNPGKLKDDGMGMLAAYEPHRVAIAPARVENKFELTLTNTDYKIIGYVDLETKPGAIIDYKTSARSPSEDAAEKSEQLSLYQLQGDNVTSLEIHALVRTKVPKVAISRALPRPKAVLDSLLTDIAKAVMLIKTGLFPKALESAPNSPCSWCGYYARCRGKERAEPAE